jgi:O-antigen/teichoic acid export membrane protein
LTIGAIYFLFGGSILADLSRTPSLRVIGGLTACWIFATSFQTLLGDIFRGFHDIRLFAIFGKSDAGFGSLMTGVLLTVGLAVLWVSGGSSDLVTVTIFAVGSGLVSVLLAGWMLGTKLKSLPSEEEQVSSIGYGRILEVAWPLAVSNFVSIALVQTSFWVVAAFRPETEVAVYGAAWRLISLVVVPLLIVNTVVSPLVAETYAQGRTETLQNVLRSTATLAGVPALVVLLGFMLFGGPILGIVFGDYYRQGALLLTVLGLAHLVMVWMGSSGIVMAMTGHQTLQMVISTFAAAITIAAGFISVRYYGALGVAVCTAAGMALQSVLEWLGTRFTTGMWTHMSPASLPRLIRSWREK